MSFKIMNILNICLYNCVMEKITVSFTCYMSRLQNTFVSGLPCLVTQIVKTTRPDDETHHVNVMLIEIAF